MSNTAQFYKHNSKPRAVPASMLMVLIESSLCPDLQVTRISRKGYPDFGKAVLKHSGGSIGPDMFIGASVTVRRFFNPSFPDSNIDSLPVFAGTVESVEDRLDEKGQSLIVTVSDASSLFNHVTINKTYVNDLKQFDFDTVFNKDGLSNASAEPVMLNGKPVKVFTEDSKQAAYWTFADTVNYLLTFFAPVADVYLPPIEQLKALADAVIYDVDVTGLSLLSALHQCCRQLGIGFRFEPVLSLTAGKQALVFYDPHRTRKIDFSIQPKGQPLDVTKTNIAAYTVKTIHPKQKTLVGKGDFKTFEATFDLIKAWDPSLEGSGIETYSPLSNPDFDKVEDVYRKFCLNEAGDYTGPPYNAGPAYDFYRIFEKVDYTQKRRRFLPCISRKPNGKNFGYYLEYSLDQGQTFNRYNRSFDILTDQCGVRLTDEQLENDLLAAALADLLRFRITASVQSDTPITTDSKNDSDAETIDCSRLFKYHKVTPQSIFYAAPPNVADLSGQKDDTVKLNQYIRRKQNLLTEPTAEIVLQTPYPMLGIHPGDGLTLCDQSRPLLHILSRSDHLATIDSVTIDFQKQSTKITAFVASISQ